MLLPPTAPAWLPLALGLLVTLVSLPYYHIAEILWISPQYTCYSTFVLQQPSALQHTHHT